MSLIQSHRSRSHRSRSHRSRSPRSPRIRSRHIAAGSLFLALLAGLVHADAASGSSRPPRQAIPTPAPHSTLRLLPDAPRSATSRSRESPISGGATDGDPVDLATGLYLISHDDLTVSDLILPLTLRRTYLLRDRRSRTFGIGTTSSYDLVVHREDQDYRTLYLVRDDGSRIYFRRVSPGTDVKSARIATTPPNGTARASAGSACGGRSGPTTAG